VAGVQQIDGRAKSLVDASDEIGDGSGFDLQDPARLLEAA
jgi:hypothetical protein